MAVTVDREPLAAEDLGLRTVGEVFAHLQKKNRLVVQVLIDGEEPEAERLGAVRQTHVKDHAVYIETANPRSLALEVLDDVQRQLHEAEGMKDEAAELLQKNQSGRALGLLGRTIRTWQNAQESVSKVAELLRLDLAAVDVKGTPLHAMLSGFSGQLKQIKAALDQRDFVLLSDVLMYETAETTGNWTAALEAMQEMVRSLR
jgi:hypothetical protein